MQDETKSVRNAELQSNVYSPIKTKRQIIEIMTPDKYKNDTWQIKTWGLKRRKWDTQNM